MRKSLLVLIALLLPTFAVAQNTIIFTAETTTGVETVTPVLSWDTQPAANTCIASGDWIGNKGAFGIETLPPITSSATYNLSCEWFDQAATLSWTAPTQNTDGTALTDLAGFKIKYGLSAGGPYPNEVDISDPLVTVHVISPLGVGVWFFVSTAYNAIGVESDNSNEAQKVIETMADVRSVGITVNPKPASPDGFSVF